MPNPLRSLSPLRSVRAAGLSACLGLLTVLTPVAVHAADTASATSTQRFATDAAVREGMVAVRQLMVAQEAAIAANQLSAADYVRLAKAIEGPMQSHLAQRSLPKAASVAFNGSIWQDLSYCVSLMRDGRSVAVQRTGALGVQQALRNYPLYFDHPGW